MGKGFKKSTRRKAIIFLCFLILYWCTYLFTGHSVIKAGESVAALDKAKRTEMKTQELEWSTGQETAQETVQGKAQETFPEMGWEILKEPES